MALILIWPKVKNILKIMKIPGPLLPKGLKGNLPDYMERPRQCGPKMSSSYGPIYRLISFATKCSFLICNLYFLSESIQQTLSH